METSLIPISPLTLRPDIPVGVDILVKHAGQSQGVLFLSADQTLDAATIRKLGESSSIRLFIRKSSRDAYQEYLREHVDQWLERDEMPDQAKAAVIGEVVRGVLHESFADGDTDRIVASVQPCGDRISDLITSVDIDGRELAKILHHDYGTFTHSANVSLYAGLLARQLSLPEREIRELVVGALLHDLGKLDIDERILNKPGRLDEQEFRVVKTHPVLGYRRLCQREDVTERQLLVAYQHHERLDGRGYPVGIPGELISPWAKLCSVVDVFEALTSERPYRHPMSYETALEVMRRDVGLSFDTEIFLCWESLIQTRTSA